MGFQAQKVKRGTKLLRFGETMEVSNSFWRRASGSAPVQREKNVFQVMIRPLIGTATSLDFQQR